MKKRKKSISKGLFLICIMGLLVCGFVHNDKDAKVKQEGIASRIIRLHVVAHSDLEKDQELKIRVKNKVVTYLQKKLDKEKTKAQAEKVIKMEIPTLKKIAKKEIQEEGFDYPVYVKLEKRIFPIKMYGDLVFPAGEYESLQIDLGKSEGRNWWCVMFPTLCMVDDSYHVVPPHSKSLLKDLLEPEEYAEITGNEKIKISYKFKMVEWLGKLKEILKKIENLV